MIVNTSKILLIVFVVFALIESESEIVPNSIATIQPQTTIMQAIIAHKANLQRLALAFITAKS